MTARSNSLAALRDQATSGIDELIAILHLGARLGVATADPAAIEPPFRKVGAFDATGFAADSRRLTAAYRAVAEHLHRLPEQQIRLDRGWTGATGEQAVSAVVEHQRRAESDLHTLRTLSEATGAASSGIDQLLRTWYVTVVRLTAPLVAGVPIEAVPEAIATGQIPLRIVGEDITARTRLYFTSAKTTIDGIDEILEQLTRATDGMDVEPYPTDLRPRPGATAAPDDPQPPNPQPPNPQPPNPQPPDPPHSDLMAATGRVTPTERPLDADAAPTTPNIAPAGAITEPTPDAGAATATPTPDAVDNAPTDVGRDLDVPLRLGNSAPSAPDAPATSAGDLALAGEE
ncbi:hypothetical protein AAFP30_20120 [Gordonia sp. CPCC 205515]|uniref:hypothetical protein n=1 Tax=Gordonia sp. CPCC 205515 TaxID=3140791 RepID=UPI003AF36413